MLTGAYLNENFHGQYYGRGQNLGRLLCKAYDNVLKDYDVLILPTIPFVAQKLPSEKLSFQGECKVYHNRAKMTSTGNKYFFLR